MSAGSFDDASNLFEQSSSPGREKEEGIAEEKEQELSEELPESVTEVHKSKSKASKALKFLKRAKSPLAGQLKAAKSPFKSLRNLPKHHYKVPKSPSKSPSKENLTEEFKNLEQTLGEKKSEEWKEFQQMQERIKQTVLKTQTSLHRYTKHDDNIDSKQSRWTGFEEEESLEPEEIIDVSLECPEINISWANNDNDDINKKLIDGSKSSTHIDSTQDISKGLAHIDTSLDSSKDFEHLDTTQDSSKGLTHLDTTPISSPPVTPAPPFNSRISSMEDLVAVSDKTKTVTQDEFDLLGLESSSAPTTIISNVELMNQDLLGLGGDDLLGTGTDILGGYSYSVSSTKNQSEISSNRSTPVEFDPNMTISDAQSEFYLTQTSTTTDTVGILDQSYQTNVDSYGFEGISSTGDIINIQSIVPNATEVSMDAKDISVTDELGGTSLIGMQAEDQLKTDEMGGLSLVPDILEPSTFISEHTDQVVPQSMQTVQSSDKVLDDLSDLDPMKASASPSVDISPVAPNLFGTSSSPIDIVPGANTSFLGGSTNVYGTSPQSMGTAFGSLPPTQAPIEQDIMLKIQKMSAVSQPVTPAKRKVAPKPPDPFGFVKKELKKPGAGDAGNENDDDDYKSIIDTMKDKTTVVAPDKANNESESIPNVENNPFLSGDFGQESYSNEGFNGSVDVAAVFGVESVDGIPVSNAPVPPMEQWTDMNTEGENSFKETWVDMSERKTDFESDGAWEAVNPIDAQSSGDAWGSTLTGDDTLGAPDVSKNPFQDDFSGFDDSQFTVTENIIKTDSTAVSANPFLDESIPIVPPMIPDATSNPFLEMNSSDAVKGSTATVLDAEAFFLDSLGETQLENTAVAMDDDFDPFKTTETKAIKTEAEATADDSLDLFVSTASTGHKQLSKSDSDEKQGFILEIKPVSEQSEIDSSVSAPAIKPPPKPPKSPQPPRENPFDRDSPPEENFAQFEIMDTEKPKDFIPKSFSTESSTTEEEEILEPLELFLPKCEKEGFKLMLRYPTKKKITGNRYWKNVFVRIEKQKEGPMVRVFSDPNDALPLQELLLQACYSLSDRCLQQYDQYGKIHTVKLQYIFYKERVGIKTDRIAPSLVKLRSSKPKANMIMDHSPQVSELLKFGSLDRDEMVLFMQEIEDTLMNLEAHREKTLTYAKDEVTAELHDEYKAELDKYGKVLMQKARVRIFVLAFLTGMPTVEVGLNDKRRRGKEVVGRNDIIPIKTEEWIRLENVEFHCSVDQEEFQKTNNIKFHPLDACQFELMRYRVRLRENKELPMQLTVQQIFKERKMEIRCDLLVTGYHSFSKKHGQFPCEDIEVRIPVPEVWIYMFRYERRFGYGAFKSTTRKPGKIKGRLGFILDPRLR